MECNLILAGPGSQSAPEKSRHIPCIPQQGSTGSGVLLQQAGMQAMYMRDDNTQDIMTACNCFCNAEQCHHMLFKPKASTLTL